MPEKLDFNLYNKLLLSASSTYDDNDEKKIKVYHPCKHDNVIDEKGLMECTDCGHEISRNVSREKDWRYYGSADSRHASDPNRVQLRKSSERTIFKDVENMGFSDKIVIAANTIYFQVTQDKIFRGASRKAIIFASVFHAYKLSGQPQPHERLIKIFKLTRKVALRGLKYINLYAPKDSAIRTTYITPENLVQDIMKKFSATGVQIKEVTELYKQIKNKSSRLNRSRPQSVASGLVYFWICQQNKNISLKEFTEKVSLSELTVNKIAKEIESIYVTKK